jgi:hypothetical protein
MFFSFKVELESFTLCPSLRFESFPSRERTLSSSESHSSELTTIQNKNGAISKEFVGYGQKKPHSVPFLRITN